MSITQKTCWIQLALFGALVIGWVTFFIIKGTIFYWQDETMKMTFYWLTAAAFAGLVLMRIAVSIVKNRLHAVIDERDLTVFRRASLWATGTSYTFVIIFLLVLSIAYTESGHDAIPASFPLLIVITGGVVLVLAQAVRRYYSTDGK